MISVITQTNRYGGIDVAYNSLKNQTYKDIEWILVDDIHEIRNDEVKKYVKDIKLKHLKPRPKLPDHVWNLPEGYNDGFNVSEGELIVILEDYIWIKPNAIEKFYKDWKTYGDALFTGVGDKISSPPVINPNGKITIYEKEFDKLPDNFEIREIDERKAYGTNVFLISDIFNFEFNWCAFPRTILNDLGGMEEKCGIVYCGQDKNFALRAKMLGYDLYIDRDNESYGIYHQDFDPRPIDWEINHFKQNGAATKNVYAGKWPLKCNYLK